MTEPEEPTFSVIVLSFSKGADDAGKGAPAVGNTVGSANDTRAYIATAVAKLQTRFAADKERLARVECIADRGVCVSVG